MALAMREQNQMSRATTAFGGSLKSSLSRFSARLSASRRRLHRVAPRPVAYAVVYAENSDIVRTYGSRDDALHDLANFVEAHPAKQDDIGLRVYENGLPVGRWV